MNKFAVLPLSACLLCWAIACVSQNAEASSQSQDLVGTWDCSLDMNQNGMNMTLETQETYDSSGQSKTFTTLKAQFADGLPEIELSIAGTSTWEISDGYLVRTLTDVEVVKLSHPEFGQIFNMQQMFPTNQSSSAKIIELTQSKLSLKSEGDVPIYECERQS